MSTFGTILQYTPSSASAVGLLREDTILLYVALYNGVMKWTWEILFPIKPSQHVSWYLQLQSTAYNIINLYLAS